MTTKDKNYDSDEESLSSTKKFIIVIATKKFIEEIRNNKLKIKMNSRYFQKIKIEKKNLIDALNCMKRCIIFMKSKKIFEQRQKKKNETESIRILNEMLQNFKNNDLNNQQSLTFL